MAPGFDEGYRHRNWSHVLTTGGHFTAPVMREVAHEVEMTGERFLDLWRSHHLLTERLGEEGVAALVADLASLLPMRGVVAVPYLCRAWTARRRG